MGGSRTVMSGMGATGALHIGHLFGVLDTWLELQKSSRCFFMVADLTALSVGISKEIVRSNTREMLLDWLSVGIDPDKVIIFRQSGVREQLELATLLGFSAPLEWFSNNPTFVEKSRRLPNGTSPTIAFLSDPLLQAADILSHGANCIPVGQDQLPQIAMAQKLAGGFNDLFGTSLIRPEALLTNTPSLIGLDGGKMSKSTGNAIGLAESLSVVKSRILNSTTAREVGRDAVECPVWQIIRADAEEDLTGDILAGCRSGTMSCIACKEVATDRLCGRLAPFRERRSIFEVGRRVTDVLEEGTMRASSNAREVVDSVRHCIGL